MDAGINKILSAKAQSIWQFMIFPGQGCYIPPYQRPYSWDEENILRLFEDVVRGIRQIVTRPDATSFIGAIIAIHDTKYETVNPVYHDEVPSRVMTIIDGQQRICTILMANIVLHEYIRRMGERFKAENDPHLAWVYNECDCILDKIQGTYMIDQLSGEGNFRFYPRLIRAYSDTWSQNRGQAKYESPMAKLIWRYIKFTKAQTTSEFQPNLGNSDDYKMVENAFLTIQKEVKRIYHSQSIEREFPNLADFAQMENPPKGLWDCTPPVEVSQYIMNASDDHHYTRFCQLSPMSNPRALFEQSRSNISCHHQK